MTPETCRICLAKEPRRSLESHASTKQLASTPRRSPLPYQRAVTAARARARAHTLGSAPGAARRAPGCCSRAGARAPAPRTAGCSARPRGRRRRPPGTRPPPAARACAPPGLRARRHFISSQPGSGCTASPCARRRALSVCHSTSQAYRRFNRAPPLLSTQSASARRHRRGARPEKRDYRTEECGSDVEASQRCLAAEPVLEMSHALGCHTQGLQSQSVSAPGAAVRLACNTAAGAWPRRPRVLTRHRASTVALRASTVAPRRGARAVRRTGRERPHEPQRAAGALPAGSVLEPLAQLVRIPHLRVEVAQAARHCQLPVQKSLAAHVAACAPSAGASAACINAPSFVPSPVNAAQHTTAATLHMQPGPFSTIHHACGTTQVTCAAAQHATRG